MPAIGGARRRTSRTLDTSITPAPLTGNSATATPAQDVGACWRARAGYTRGRTHHRPNRSRDRGHHGPHVGHGAVRHVADRSISF